jgi:hypothetical protein
LESHYQVGSVVLSSQQLAEGTAAAAVEEALRQWRSEAHGEVYCDEKVANRDTKVWHGATENGP